MAWLASPCLACHARLRHEGSNPASGEQHDAQKKKRGIKARPALDPLVSSGNPAHRYSSCAKTHRARPRHRMVHLATRTSGRSPQSPHKTESATVVLLVHASALIHPSAILRNEAQIIRSSPNILADGKTAIGGGSRSGGSAGLEVGRNRIHRREWRRTGRT